MRAAQRLLEYAAQEGVTACFANPGTSEMHLVAALDAVPQIRPILCLFEGVATGAADGFGRMAANPALTLLHLGPGLANGLANLHNAYRARTPILSLIGEHATFHRDNNPPLATDIEALARPVSAWLKTTTRAEAIVSDAALGLRAARRDGPASLILPADIAWSDIEPDTPGASADHSPAPDRHSKIDSAAQALGARTVVLLGGRRLSARACAAAQRIAEKTGAQVYVETFPTRIERGGGGAPLRRLPYLSEMASGLLANAETIILAGATKPVAFFALPGRPTELAPPEAALIELFPPFGDPTEVLEALAEAVGAGSRHILTAATTAGAVDSNAPLDASGLSAALAATLPEGAIVSDESNTLGLYAFDAAAGAPPHDWLTLTGGAIGQGLPLATGAAVACPNRRVVALQADGSALYTIQALWSQAREGLNVTNVILNNGAYAILKLEMMRAGINAQTEAAAALFDLQRPSIDFTEIAQGFGVPAQRVTTVDELSAALRRSFATPGPSLIEAMFK
ncbi:acetolactate synthase large subunit [Terricaulis sp.]|uniref:acetolactate synthase large subunit n=1 Tax=Terricaulis sp. TaxID=2768686 RepID=UPI0037843FA0